MNGNQIEILPVEKCTLSLKKIGSKSISSFICWKRIKSRVLSDHVC